MPRSGRRQRLKTCAESAVFVLQAYGGPMVILAAGFFCLLGKTLFKGNSGQRRDLKSAVLRPTIIRNLIHRK